MAHIHSNALIGASGAAGAAGDADYIIPKSLRFNSGDSAHLSRTPDSAGNRRTWTWSAWVKRSKLGERVALFTAATDNTEILFEPDDKLRIYFFPGSYAGHTKTVASFRDTSAWYHIVFAIDTTKTGNDNIAKIYVNGVQQDVTHPNNWTQNGETNVNNTVAHYIGSRYGPARLINAYMADVQLVDGQQLEPTAFGETRESDGVWVPKEASFTSLNDGTTWSSTLTLSSAHSSNTPASKGFDGEMGTGNTGFALTAGAGTIEWTASSYTFPANATVEVWKSDTGRNDLRYWNVDTGSGYGSNIAEDGNLGWLSLGTLSNIQKIRCVGTNVNGYGASWAGIRINGEVLLDGVSNKYGVNGFHLNFSDSSTNEALGFDSAPTTPDPDPKKGFDVVTYDGNGGTQNIGGLNFEPGLVWLKTRTGHSAKSHGLFDVVRGPTKFLSSNSTAAENSSYDNNLTAFNPDGFTLLDEPDFNTGGRTYVGWCWRAGGPAVPNTAGTITSQVSASTDYGFSIVKWTGTAATATVGHGLSSAPKWILVKFTGSTSQWSVYHASVGNTKRLLLNSTAAAATGSTYWNDTSPTSTLFTVGGDLNDSTEIIAYCWSEVAGFSKFGSWTGTGSASGNKVTTGFKPRFLMWKRTDTADNWAMIDSERSPSNPRNEWLGPFSTDAAGSNAAYAVDFLDDGFELKATHVATNASGGNYVYMCFADRPGSNWDVNNIVTNEGLTTSKTQFDVVNYTGNGGTNVIGGPIYSAGATATGGFESSNPAANGFNGTLTAGDRANGVTVGGTIEIVFSPGLSVSSTVGIWSGKSGFKYQINDSGSYTSVTNATEQWHDASFSGTLTNLKIQHTASNEAPGFSGIRVDGTTLLDGTGLGLKFQPDFVWIKQRNATRDHVLQDSIRGTGVFLSSNTTSADQSNGGTGSSSLGIQSFNSNGFTLGAGTGVNTNNGSYVAWAWKAGGTAASNTDGSITSSVSANAAYGFSVVTWTGTATAGTIGHGLNGKVPKFIITKRRDSSGDWYSQHASLGATYRIQLNSNSAATSGTSLWNSTSPTGSVFSVGGDNEVNASGGTFVAYCFADIPGYQRIGTYHTNSSDPVVITGFKPRFLLVKKHDGVGNWMLLDSQRSTDDDDIRTTFEINNNNGEETHANRQVKFLDNGFQLIGADMDTSNSDWIYWAIGDDEIGSDEDCLVDVPNAVTADADATDTTGGYQRGNYATLNPLDTKLVHSNGNLDATSSSSQTWVTGRATVGMPSGKFYWEITVNTVSHTDQNTIQLGISDLTAALPANDAYQDSNSWVYANYSQQKANGGSASSYGARYTAGDTVGVAYDADNGTLAFYVNGVSQGDAYTSLDTSKNFGPVITLGRGGTSTSISANFGQMRFKYPMPSGYSALNTTALPAATIPDGSAQFETRLYTANATARSLTGYKFAPDWLWFKPRVAGSHNLYDTVRGATKGLRSQSTNSEYTDAQTLTSFNSDGFSLGDDSGGYQVNYSNNSMVVWAWNAGSSTVSNTDGSITSSVRANPTAGFSIVTYTGTGSAGTVGHGLNAAPEMIILKGRNFADNWRVYHKDLDSTEPEDYYLMLESLNQRSADQNASFMNDTAPTNSVFSLGTDSAINGSSRTMVAYCFTSVSGYSQLGSFEGNGNANGPFVYLGFRPAFVLIRLIEGANSSWKLYDSARDPDNPIEKQLYANSTNGEPSDDVRCDFLSNGFKVRTPGSEDNYNNNTLIYYAVAENPFQANGGLAR